MREIDGVVRGRFHRERVTRPAIDKDAITHSPGLLRAVVRLIPAPTSPNQEAVGSSDRMVVDELPAVIVIELIGATSDVDGNVSRRQERPAVKWVQREHRH